jgi:hypothetical protein
MGKRSAFERLPQDSYDTPFEALAPLLPHLKPRTRFIEPCVGYGCLVEHLTRAGHVCVGQYDLPTDARFARYDIPEGAVFITNPPWRRDALHAIIANLSDQAPTWLLLAGDWLHTQQSIPYLMRLRTIVSIGRVRWIPDSPYDGKDNAVWTLFDQPDSGAATRFVGRVAKNDLAVLTLPPPLTEAAE